MCWNFQHDFFKMFSTHLKHEIHLYYEPCWNLCWKPCQKFQSVSKITMTWPLCDPFHQFWNIIAVIKIKSYIINEDYRSLWCHMWSLIEILCGLEEKSGPFCVQFLHNVHAMENFWIQPCCKLPFKLSKFVKYFSGIRKLRTFERNACSWNSYLMPWRWII